MPIVAMTKATSPPTNGATPINPSKRMPTTTAITGVFHVSRALAASKIFSPTSRPIAIQPTSDASANASHITSVIGIPQIVMINSRPSANATIVVKHPTPRLGSAASRATSPTCFVCWGQNETVSAPIAAIASAASRPRTIPNAAPTNPPNKPPPTVSGKLDEGGTGGTGGTGKLPRVVRPRTTAPSLRSRNPPIGVTLPATTAVGSSVMLPPNTVTSP